MAKRTVFFEGHPGEDAIHAPKSSASVATPKAPKPKYVTIENKLGQVLSLSVVSDDGNAVELRLEPYGSSSPVRIDRLTPSVHRLAQAGRVRIR